MLNLAYLTLTFHNSAAHVIVYFQEMFHTLRSRDSELGIAIGYGLDERGVGVRVPVGSRIFFFPRRPEPTSYRMGTGGYFLGGKAAEA
jgi:hypothetical protein